MRLGYRGELCVDHLVWLRARPYDPTTRAFLAPDPLPNPPGAPCGANPYHYAWNDPVSLVDPAGLRPLTQEEFDHRRHIDEIGGLRQAGEAISQDPWGSLALGLTIAVGVGLCFVPGAGIVGAGILIGVGTSTAMGVATGTFDPKAVAFSGDLGGLTGGIGSGIAGSALGPISKIGAMALVGGADSAALRGFVGAPFSWRSTAESAAAAGLMAGLPWLDSLLANRSPTGPMLFRGTSEGYPGSPGIRKVGITPTTTDPLVATAFGTHAEQFGRGIVYIASPSDLAGVKTSTTGYLSYELQVEVRLTPGAFAARAGASISAPQARAILLQLGLNVPGSLASPSDLADYLRDSPRLTPDEIKDFSRQAKSR